MLWSQQACFLIATLQGTFIERVFKTICKERKIFEVYLSFSFIWTYVTSLSDPSRRQQPSMSEEYLQS